MKKKSTKKRFDESPYYLVFCITVLCYLILSQYISEILLCFAVLCIIGTIVFMRHIKKKNIKEAEAKCGLPQLDNMTDDILDKFLSYHFNNMGYKKSDNSEFLLFSKDNKTLLISYHRHNKLATSETILGFADKMLYSGADAGRLYSFTPYTREAYRSAIGASMLLLDRSDFASEFSKKEVDDFYVTTGIKDDNICPVCGGEIIKIDGLFSSRVGCSNCKYSKSLSK